jgi:hypothetical protein
MFFVDHLNPSQPSTAGRNEDRRIEQHSRP